MSLHIARRKLLFSAQNINNFERLLCQQGVVITQECCYHSLNENQARGKKRERGKWRGYSEGGAGTAPSSWKNAAFGAVALSAGAAIGKFYFQSNILNKLQLAFNHWNESPFLGQKWLFTGTDKEQSLSLLSRIRKLVINNPAYFVQNIINNCFNLIYCFAVF